MKSTRNILITWAIILCSSIATKSQIAPNLNSASQFSMVAGLNIGSSNGKLAVIK